jgi:hypothetical protein
MTGGFPALPCYPCPHDSACCGYGTTLDDSEAELISVRYGAHLIYRARDGGWRTRVRGGRCVFYRNRGCELYASDCYPAVCAGFPWTDVETGGPYEFDRTICPEFLTRPDLVRINPLVRGPSRD